MLYISLIVMTILAIVYVVDKIKKYNESRARELFDNLLTPLCNNATSQQEILIAWNILHAQCINAMTRFTIPKSYMPKFTELKASLQFKLDSLRHK